MKLHEHFRQYAPDGTIPPILMEDVERCADTYNANQHDQFWRRAFVRTVFAAIEGMNNFFKQSIYSFHERNVRPMNHVFEVFKIDGEGPFKGNLQSDADLLLLLDRVTSLNQEGSPKIKEAFCPMIGSIRFMFEMADRVYGLNHAPDYSAVGWRDLRDGVAVRNRLTHPKLDDDLVVRDEEVQKTSCGYNWFTTATEEMMDRVAEVARSDEKKLDAYLKNLPTKKLAVLLDVLGVPASEFSKEFGVD